MQSMLPLLVGRHTMHTAIPVYGIVTSLRHVNLRHVHDESSSEAEMAAAREWLAHFGPETIPKNICDISFSRSSGPGGQNVNKYEQ